MKIIYPILTAAALSVATMAAADPARQAIVDFYANAAGVTDFSAEGGKSLFETTQVGGQPDTNVCTACHGTNHTDTGRTRAGKTIEPMAVSANPARFTDLEKVEKWFRRNCDTVLGRQCTAHEKGNVIAYFSSL